MANRCPLLFVLLFRTRNYLVSGAKWEGVAVDHPFPSFPAIAVLIVRPPRGLWR